MQENKHDKLYTSNPCSDNPCEKYGEKVVCISIPGEGQKLTHKCVCSVGYQERNGKCAQFIVKPQTCDQVSCHAGTCILKDGKPECKCNVFYYGKYCQSYICSGFCMNDGRCIPLNKMKSSNESSAICICKHGFEGERCEIATKDCQDYCHNNATCNINPKTQTLECNCKPPFIGEHCDQCPGMSCGLGKCALDSEGEPHCTCQGSNCMRKDCSNFVCQHNGTCYIDPLSNQPECKCTDGMYTGRLCEMDKCQSTFCRNGGSGFRENGRCICACRGGFAGEKCDVPISNFFACLGAEVCENGGTCMELNNTKVCSCPLNYVGRTCNIRVSEEINPCKGFSCENEGVCRADLSNRGTYTASCLCDQKHTGERCESLNRCYKHCLNGGSCFSDGNTVRCHCLEGWTGGRCSLRFEEGGRDSPDNEAINSLTVTIVTVSIVALALLAALVYLVVFLIQKRQLTSPFKHRRMQESGVAGMHVEFSNRMFLQDGEEMDDQIQPSTNFVNPVYETMFLESRSIIKEGTVLHPDIIEMTSADSERSGLLRGNDKPPADGRPVIHTDSD